MTSNIADVIRDSNGAWKSESAFWSFVKGILRRGWMRHPVKIEFIKAHRVRIPSKQPKSAKEVWGMQCSCCKNTYPMREIQIDHCSGDTARLTREEDIPSAAKHLLLVSFSDLTSLCKPCHAAITLARDRGITFAEAVIEKKTIAFGKESVAKQREVLTSVCKYETIAVNAKGRAEQYRQWLISQERTLNE